MHFVWLYETIRTFFLTFYSENFEPPKINSQKKDWFHPEVDRVVSHNLAWTQVWLFKNMGKVRTCKTNALFNTRALNKQHPEMGYIKQKKCLLACAKYAGFMVFFVASVGMHLCFIIALSVVYLLPVMIYGWVRRPPCRQNKIYFYHYGSWGCWLGSLTASLKPPVIYYWLF